jgi:nucleoside-diphosphate-sugar epimerase|tara:strand:- start:2684 stop:3565 length:882 start_codon:yes stop_codon:yes gene_type:complete
MLTDKPNIIVTGGCGFIGSHLTKQLLENGFAVTVVDDNRTGKTFFKHEAVEYWKVDVKDFNPHKSHIEPPVAIFHLANSPRVRRSLEYPTDTIVNNVGSTCAVADWARTFNIKLFFATSSSTQYIESRGNPYTFSKLVCEETLNLYRTLYSLDYVLMFFYNVYGPGEADYGEYSTVVRKFKKDYLQGKSLTIFGTGKKERDFTHVDDVVQGLIQLLADPGLPAKAHFGKGEPQTISSIADSFDHHVVHSFDRKGEADKTLCTDPYIECPNNVHDYIKNWVKENKSDVTKNSSG